MKQIDYITQGTCSKMIHVEIDDNDIIQQAVIIGGCSGNTQGVCALVKGQSAQEVISRLRGIKCGARPTSCPDQLSHAIEDCLAQNK